MTTFKSIRAIGIEVEGGWKKNRVYTDTDQGEYKRGFHTDGSVSGIPTISGERLWIGEYAEPKPALSYEELMEGMKNNWPDGWNNTCGFHIHVSVKDVGAYGRLMDQTFYRIFKRDMEKNLIKEIKDVNVQATFQDRLIGNNSYCKKGWAAEIQAQQVQKENHRYRHLNFCWKLHGTMEIRVPPMMPLNDGETTVTWMVDYIEKYLGTKRKEKIFKADIETPALEASPKEIFTSTISNKPEE